MTKSISCIALVAILLTGLGQAEEIKSIVKKEDKVVASYPLTTCVISKEKLGEMGKPIVLDHQGREVQLCCKECIAEFKKDPSSSLAILDAAVIAQQGSSYPLDTCVVSKEKLGDHGKVVDHVYKNRLIRFCCKACLKDFNADPEKFLKMIDEAAAKKKS
jgi:YHS domain-containing protein